MAFGKSRYRVEKNNEVNKTAAAGICEGLGGKLVQLSSIVEREQVGNITAAAGGNATFVFNGMNLEGDVWKWHATRERASI